MKFHTSSGCCDTLLGSGTSLYTEPNGNYDILYHDNTCLQIDSEGTVSYIPRPDSNLEIHDPNQHLQYVLRHFDPILIETVDNEGNQYRVTNAGESIVILKEERKNHEAKSEEVDCAKEKGGENMGAVEHGETGKEKEQQEKEKDETEHVHEEEENVDEKGVGGEGWKERPGGRYGPEM